MRERTGRWTTLTRVGALLGLALIAAALMVRHVRALALVQTDYVSGALWVAGAVLVALGLVLNLRPLIGWVRRQRAAEGFHFMLVLSLSLVLAALLMYISTRRFARMDWTGQRRYTLHSKTENILRSLDKNVEVTLLYDSLSGQFPPRAVDTALDMLEEFRAHSARLTVRPLDLGPMESYQKVQEMMQRLGEENLPRFCAVFAAVDAHEVVPFDRIFHSSMGPGGPPDVFTGEDAFAGAIVALLEREKAAVYFLTGHGELSVEGAPPPLPPGMPGAMPVPADRSLSRLAARLRRDNYDVRTLDLTTEQAVPDDCAALVVASARAPLAETEIKALRDYLGEGSGSAVFMVDPDALPGGGSNVGELLSDHGIRLHTDAVGMAHVPALLGAVLGMVPAPRVPVAGDGYADHPITRDLRNYALTLVFPCPVGIESERPGQMSRAAPLLTGIPGSWGERDYMADERELEQYDPGRDLAPPVTVAAVVEPALPPELGPAPPEMERDLPGARLLVVGSSLSFTDAAVEGEPANLDLMVNAVNWMAGKMHLLGIPPKTVESPTVDVAPSSVVAARYVFMGVLPACIVLCGVGVWFLRRR